MKAKKIFGEEIFEEFFKNYLRREFLEISRTFLGMSNAGRKRPMKYGFLKMLNKIVCSSIILVIIQSELITTIIDQ